MERRALIATASLVALAAVAPVWASRFLPLLDEPNHLSAIAIWHDLVTGERGVSEFYALRLAPVSYLAHYGLACLLSLPLGVETAHKLVLSLAVLGIPAAAWLFCKQSGRSPALALLTVPLAFGASWAHGFHSFGLGVPAALFGIVLVDRYLAAPSPRRLALITLAATFCYFCHPIPLAALYLGASVLFLLYPLRKTHALVPLSLLPSFGLLVWQSFATKLQSNAAGSSLGKDFPVLDPSVWAARIEDLPEHAVNPLSAEWDSWLFVGLLALTAVFMRATHGPPEAEQSLRARLLDLRAMLLAAAFLVAYLVLPEHLDPPVYIWIARGRLAPFIGFFLLLASPVGARSKLRFVALAAGLLLTALPLAAAHAYRDFGEEMGAMERALAACPEGENVLTLRPGDQGHESAELPIFRQLPSWVQVVRGGYSPQHFPRPIPFPFEVVKNLPAPPWFNHGNHRAALDRDAYGCVLTHRFEGSLPEQHWELAFAEGDFSLYLARPKGAAQSAAKRSPRSQSRSGEKPASPPPRSGEK